MVPIPMDKSKHPLELSALILLSSEMLKLQRRQRNIVD
jgi:hypothetical protein